ncbi:TetR/AcrR family transcriptional regulator [Ralstonia chuxiongensis]|uniref:TetR/AcrR family transcriptional regulator n=1 Tax=Ralstonia chuxiongensis TaxID=2957504 RepID=A0AA41WTL8_9RALS|nr:TetR/AcrR family transcriptional regulator [Ralstonia chuxiongensis]MCP1174933.1 TetR/AcrR family transcriptional regulator [Ralstonia chuxiongensis]
MRYPAAETAEKHSRILSAASALFREHGFAGVSVGKIMQATGLTHGPFYNHFESKEALISESLHDASEKALAVMDAASGTPEELLAYLYGYLSKEHRDAPGQGCLLAALASEIAREQDARSVLTRHVVAMTDKLQRLFPWRVKKNARSQSIQTLSMMVGALTLARAVDDPKLSEEILREAREMIEGSQSKVRQSTHSRE